MLEADLFGLDKPYKLNIKPKFVGYSLVILGAVLALVGVFGYVWQANTLASSCSLSSELEKEGVTLVADDEVQIWVDVAGAVKHPGIYKLKFGSRVADAVYLAGGFSDKVDKVYVNKQLNLAQKLKDEAKIYIPFKGENKLVLKEQGDSISGVSLSDGWVKAGSFMSELDVSTAVPANKISLNQATRDDLESLPGIGPVRAEKIIQARPFQTLDELVTKKIIPNSVFEQIKADLVL